MADSQLVSLQRGTIDPPNPPTPRVKIRSIVCAALFLLFLLLIGAGIVVGVALVLALPNPKGPSSFSLTFATVYPFNISSSRLTATWDISLSFANFEPRVQILYDRVQASIYYGPHYLSEASILPFYVPIHVTETRHAKLEAHSELVDGGAAESMARDLALHGAVDFRLVLLVWRRFNSIVPSPTDFVRLSCENVTVGFPPSGADRPGVLLGPPRELNRFAG